MEQKSLKHAHFIEKEVDHPHCMICRKPISGNQPVLSGIHCNKCGLIYEVDDSVVARYDDYDELRRVVWTDYADMCFRTRYPYECDVQECE